MDCAHPQSAPRRAAFACPQPCKNASKFAPSGGARGHATKGARRRLQFPGVLSRTELARAAMP
eukprot:13575309-Alexandrium_andersonii.AAC.1